MNNGKINILNWKSIVFMISFLLIWEISSRFGLVNVLFVSSPIKILIAEFNFISSGYMLPYLLTSLSFLFIGLFFAVFLGFFAGLFIGASKLLYDIFFPIIMILNALPMIAVMPLLILWAGIGLFSKVIIVFILAFIPILINIIDGVRNTDQKYIYMAKSFGASDYFITRNIFLYNALPYFITGLKSAVGRSIVGVVIADLFGAASGLGYLLSLYGGMFQTSKVMAIILTLLLISLTLTYIISILEKRIVKYK